MDYTLLFILVNVFFYQRLPYYGVFSCIIGEGGKKEDGRGLGEVEVKCSLVEKVGIDTPCGFTVRNILEQPLTAVALFNVPKTCVCYLGTCRVQSLHNPIS